jgi:hypothetical protein
MSSSNSYLSASSSLSSTIQLIAFFITFAFYVTFLVYLFKLEKIGCKCALNWRRQYIIAFIFISFVWNIVNLVMPSLSQNVLLALIMLVLFLMFIAFTIQYVDNLKKQKCECSKEITRDIMYVYSWIMVALIGLAVMVPILMGLTLVLFKK